jgi:hypothetical protein
MLGRTVFAVTALLVSTAVLAASPKGPIGPNGIIASPDGVAFATRPSTLHYAQPPIATAGLTKIFDNLSHYPDGVYWCCTSFIISGTKSEFAAQSWIAAPFTPTANLTVSKIVLGLGYVSGKNAVVVTLNSDSAGLPGSELGSTTISGLADFPGCCLVAQAKGQGVPVSAGQQYWVVVKTNSSNSDTWAGWAFNDTEQVNLTSVAVNSGSGWEPLPSLGAPAFEVLGK